MKKNKKNGFTLAEVLIALTVVGVVAVVLIGALGKIKPNKEKVLFRKAYNTTVRIVSEMINDEELFSDSEVLTDTSEVTYRGKTYSGLTKFCKLFEAMANVSEVVTSCDESTNDDRVWTDKQSTISGPYFTTTDGMVWSVPPYAMKGSGDTLYSYTIFVDVNGLENGPNCTDFSTAQFIDTYAYIGYSLDGEELICGENATYDRFVIKVYTDGKVAVYDDTKAQEYLSDTSVN